MNEEKSQEVENSNKEGEEKPIENISDGVPTEERKTPSMIDGAVLAAEELRKQNDRKEELLKREEELEAKKILGGRSQAGGDSVKVEESASDYAKKAMSGEI